jgi:hypothetical protein
MSDLLQNLAKLNGTKVFLGALVVALIGLFVPGLLGGVILLAVVALMGSLLRRTWAVSPPGPRALRVLVLGILTVIALAKIF